MSPALSCLTDSLSMLSLPPSKVVHLAFGMSVQVMYELHYSFSCVIQCCRVWSSHIWTALLPTGLSVQLFISWMFISLIGHSQVMHVELCLCNCSFVGSLRVFLLRLRRCSGTRMPF